MSARDYDTVVVGAGHNGLVCATLLARRGQSVLVVEAADAVGGLAATREFAPGFRAPIAHTIRHFPARIIADLGLEAHGLQVNAEPMPLVGLAADGSHVVINGDDVTGASEDDARAYREYRQTMHRFAEALRPFWLKTMPRIGAGDFAGIMTFAHIGLKLRGLGRENLQEFLRVVSLPARDLMDENFDHDLLKAMLCWDGLVGLSQAPRSPNNSVLAMLYRTGGARVSGLVEALHAAAIAAGVEIRTGAPVSRIDIESGDAGLVVRGVHLDGGEHIRTDRVVSSADPKTTFLKLVGVENLEIGFTNRIRRLRAAGLVAKLHLGLTALPEFPGLHPPAGRLLTAPDVDAIEFAFDDAKYGERSRRPVLEMLLPSLDDPALAPAGQHVLSVNVMYVPHALKGGWHDAAREALADRIIDTIETYAPGIRDLIVHSELLTPADLERTCGVTGGHWHHAEFALDQALMMRPTYEAAQYGTPLPGLYLCGAGCHPGGDVTGAPGYNAAREILR